jgi:meso-butanediol dehydrogenase/(S,S)-butanediol dehydrogenase/diacetyl reductase
MRFSNCVAIVTGGASGIGLATTQLLTKEGATVAVLDVDPDAEGVIASIGGAFAVSCDIADPASVRAAVARVRERTNRVDILVNNAACCTPFDLATVDLDTWRRDLAVTLDGTFLTTQAVLAPMRSQGSGVIVNVASVNGIASFGNEAYSAAKAGVLSLTRSVAAEYASEGIRCNAVVPGTIRTPIWEPRLTADPNLLDTIQRHYPLGRIGSPEDVANAIAFLASAQASWITGTALVVDGGLTAASSPLLADLREADRRVLGLE